RSPLAVAGRAVLRGAGGVSLLCGQGAAGQRRRGVLAHGGSDPPPTAVDGSPPRGDPSGAARAVLLPGPGAGSNGAESARNHCISALLPSRGARPLHPAAKAGGPP